MSGKGDAVKLTDETSIITDIAISSGISEQNGMDLPPLIFAQSGAIYFEK